MLLAASTQQSVAIVVAVVVSIGWLLWLMANARRAKPEVGSELELAPNRKEYLDDEALEGPKLNRALSWGLVSLAIVALGLPLYWLFEPSRQSGAIDNFEDIFISRGEEMFAPTAADGLNCAGCHGGMEAPGGVAAYTLTEPVPGPDGEPELGPDGQPLTTIRQVEWSAPSLNDVLLRYSEDEVRYILVYGRPFSPMPAWGIDGGGPLNEQQIDNLIAYIRSIQLSPTEAKEQNLTEYGDTDGQALFEAFCARCHTVGFSYGEPDVDGGGAFGPNLTGGATVRQFPVAADHLEFITEGAENGEPYGRQGQSRAGMMPGFGQHLTEEQIKAIVEYERSL